MNVERNTVWVNQANAAQSLKHHTVMWPTNTVWEGVLSISVSTSMHALDPKTLVPPHTYQSFTSCDHIYCALERPNSTYRTSLGNSLNSGLEDMLDVGVQADCEGEGCYIHQHRWLCASDGGRGHSHYRTSLNLLREDRASCL